MQLKLRQSLQVITVVAFVLSANVGFARELSLAHFLGPGSANNLVFKAFAEKLAEVSGGEMSVAIFPGGALNSVPPRQYSILLNGVADIVFVVPGFTAELFPKTNVVNYPDICAKALDCTRALLNAQRELVKEYDAKVLAIWASSAPILITRDKAVRTFEDLEGMKIRVTSKHNVPFVEALNASAVAQPVTVIHQNLTNGVIDAITTTPSAIRSFRLHEPANYVTTYFPGSGIAFILLMNQQVYNSLTEQQKEWVDAASGEWLSLYAGQVYEESDDTGLEFARDAGVEIVELTASERVRFGAAIQPTFDAILQQPVGDKTVQEIIQLMKR